MTLDQMTAAECGLNESGRRLVACAPCDGRLLAIAVVPGPYSGEPDLPRWIRVTCWLPPRSICERSGRGLAVVLIVAVTAWLLPRPQMVVAHRRGIKKLSL